MNQEKKEELLRGMFAGATFTQSVVVGVAESGSTICYQGVKDVEASKENNEPDEDMMQERMMNAIENCQEYFWGNSAYAVLFCLIRDEYNGNYTQSGFERMLEMLPYKKRLSYQCPTGTIANAFSDNMIYKLPVSRWESQGAQKRVITLLNKLREEL